MNQGVSLVGLLLVTACGATPPTAPDATPVDGTPMMGAPGSDARITRGTLMGAGRYSARGEVTLTVSAGMAVLELGEGFSASGVPDPVLYVGSSADPNFGNALRIGRYQSSGTQRFAFVLPEGTDARFAILWCDRFNVPVGFAALR
jgi:hypothetical protein